MASVPDVGATPEAIVEAQDTLQHRLDALNGLPELQRHVFLLHRIDGLTYADISQALGIPARTAKVTFQPSNTLS